MEVPIYDNLKDFKENYIVTYSRFIDNYTYYEYLTKCKSLYSHKINIDFDFKNIYLLERYVPKDRMRAFRTIVKGNFSVDDCCDIYFENDHVGKNMYYEHFKEYYFEYKKLQSSMQSQKNRDENRKIILKFINEEIEREKNNILRFQPSSIQNKINLQTEDLNPKQVQKIGLLFRSGIINFIREKNPKISNNQIAGFIELLTKEPLKQTSINPHLSTTNSKYAIQNQQDKIDLDLILKKFGISPQS